mgnify:CR=1 FL=1
MPMQSRYGIPALSNAKRVGRMPAGRSAIDAYAEKAEPLSRSALRGLSQAKIKRGIAC